jgi:GAF domain-containing protein
LDELASELVNLARSLEAEDDTDAMLADLVAAAVAQVGGAEEGSISMVVGRRDVTSRYATSELPARVDALQSETAEGPCLSAVYEHQTVRANDLTQDDRWPNFAGRAVEVGAASMLSFQLYVEGDNLGALNLYSRQPEAFDDESEHIGLMLAAHGAVAMAGALQQDQLRTSVETRDLIGQAKGILMERHKVDARQAFSALLRISQDTNRKLRDVADELTTTGQMPRHTQGPPPVQNHGGRRRTT